MVRYPQKIQDILAVIKKCIEHGRYLDTRHANERQFEKGITRPEIIYVLKNGHHERKKDKYDEMYQTWKYSIKGKTVDKRELRIIISFDENNGIIIITAIDLIK